MRRVYLAGPISGQPDNNRNTFQTAARWVAAQGHQPINPLDLTPTHNGECPHGPAETGDGGTHSRGCWLRVGLAALLACDAVLMLPGWEQSQGARLEHEVALACGIPVEPHSHGSEAA